MKKYATTSTSGDAVRAAWTTALWTFLGVFGMSVLGWLGEVAEWASSSGAHAFPSTSVLGYAFISAGAAAGSFVVAALVRAAQAAGWIPGKPPTYPKDL